MSLHWSQLDPAILAILRGGAVIPAHPLALNRDRAFDRRRQQALSRYYIDAGAGGLAVSIHATQFAIREAGLYRPVLELAVATAREWTSRPLVLIAGLAGRTEQAASEARLATSLGFHAALLSLAAMKGAAEGELIEHCAATAKEMPLVGFYLQPAVGGLVLSASFWRRFAALDNVIAIKIAPFNRYRTIDVVRGVVEARAEDRVTLYTGNDDHIVLDLAVPFSVTRDGAPVSVRIKGDSSAIGACGRAAPLHCWMKSTRQSRRVKSRQRCWRATRALPTAMAPSSTLPTISAAASPAVTRCCDGRACWKARGASIQPRG